MWAAARVPLSSPLRPSPGARQRALERQRELQERDRVAGGDRWHEHGLVFASMVGTPLDPSHVRRDFRTAIHGVPGLDPAEWTPRELRHSFVSLLSTTALQLTRLRNSSGIAAQQSRSWSTASRSARFFRRVPWSWIASSRTSLMRSYSFGYSPGRLSCAFCPAARVTWAFVVGMARFELAAYCSQSRISVHFRS
jgi:hypothetical protein